MSDERIVPCEACASEGRILRGSYDDERDCGPCPFCEGTGGEIIETQPVQQGEIEAREECASEGNTLASALPDDRLVQPQSLGCGDSSHTRPQPGGAVAGTERAPPGYSKLPDGMICKCFKMWRGSDGSHWCCLPSPVSRPQSQATEKRDGSQS